jgi:hypothetical protein
MTPDLIALGRRAVACAGWRWKAAGISERIGGYLRVPFDALPDLSDPATRGCLLALVREAWGDPHLSAVAFAGDWRVHGDSDGMCSHDHDTEAEALIAALEAAPRRTT